MIQLCILLKMRVIKIKKIYSKIIGTGSYLPDFVLTNEMLSKIMDTNDEWITTRTGMKERRVEQEKQTYQLLAEAGKLIIEDAGIDKDAIDMIIVSTITSDYYYPSMACSVQHELECENAVSFDISAACSGFIYAVDMADLYIKSGRKNNILIIAGDILTRIQDYSDRKTSILFGDGAAGILLSASEEGESDVINSFIKSDAKNISFLKAPSRTTVPIFDTETKAFLGNSNGTVPNGNHMDGTEVYKFAVTIAPKAIETALEGTGYGIEDLDFIIAHQANKRILESIIKRYNFDPKKFPIIIEKTGNSSSSTMPMILNTLVKDGRLKRGHLIAVVGFGAGLTFGANIIRW